jgi:hypothetical protein
VEAEVDTQSALQDAQEAEKRMYPLSPAGQDVQADLDASDSLQDAYLKPLRIFDQVIENITDVCRSSSRSELN